MTTHTRLPVPPLSAPVRTTLKLAAAAAVTVMLAGCEHDGNRGKVAGWTLIDPAQRHPIIVSQQPQELPLNVARGSQGLTPQQRAALLGFADRARASDAGNSRLVISAPSGSRNEVAAMHVVGEIRRLLSDRGFPESLIQVEAYTEDGAAEPPVKVSYLRYVAEGPQCQNWSTNLAFEPQNLPYPNFGCANQRNLAAMVANPADLLGPRTESERSSERRDAVWEKYVKGESSNTEKSEDEKVDTQSSN
jgi:pilus assembly protein CpaD